MIGCREKRAELCIPTMANAIQLMRRAISEFRALQKLIAPNLVQSKPDLILIFEDFESTCDPTDEGDGCMVSQLDVWMF